MRKVSSLLPTIRALGGINVNQLRDLTGENRCGRAGILPGLFRKPTAGARSGLKVAGFGLDELVPRLQECGFAIRADDVDGGVADLRELIAEEIGGFSKVYPADYQPAPTWGEPGPEDCQDRAPVVVARGRAKRICGSVKYAGPSILELLERAIALRSGG